MNSFFFILAGFLFLGAVIVAFVGMVSMKPIPAKADGTPGVDARLWYKKRRNIMCMLLGGWAVSLVLTFATAGAAAPHNGSEFEAQKACEDVVTQHLKSPASAKFDSSATGDGPYNVEGTVDSQNGFGAMLRAEFSCDVEFTDGAGVATLNYLN